MIAPDQLRGNNIELKDGEYIYSDTLEKTKDNWKEKPCGHCGLVLTKDGHDGCLGELPGVINACCGHGIKKDCYIQYSGGNIIRGNSALDIIIELTIKELTIK